MHCNLTCNTNTQSRSRKLLRPNNEREKLSQQSDRPLTVTDYELKDENTKSCHSPLSTDPGQSINSSFSLQTTGQKSFIDYISYSVLRIRIRTFSSDPIKSSGSGSDQKSHKTRNKSHKLNIRFLKKKKKSSKYN